LLAVAISLVLPACGGDDRGGSGAVSSEDCGVCHVSQVAAWEGFSSHRALFDCSSCHAEVNPVPGTGHRVTPGCDGCHSEASHPAPRPASGVEASDGMQQDSPTPSCARCHDPHGSKNISLIVESIRLRDGRQLAIDFRSRLGRADGSYAELPASEGGTNDREPGSGLCEVCHAGTRVYNRSGTGEAHFTRRCTACHDHAHSFAVD
jgi:hypothetical protein